MTDPIAFTEDEVLGINPLFDEGGQWKGPKFPPISPTVERRSLQSADLDVRICSHELAAALAVFAGEDPALADVPTEFQNAAERLLELVATFPKCASKGVA